MIAVQKAESEIRETERELGRSVTRSGTNDASVEAVELLSRGQPVRALRSGDPATIRLDIRVERPIEELTAGILIRDRLGNDVFGTNTFHLEAPRRHLAAGERLSAEFEVPAMNLGQGTYSLTVALHAHETHIAANYDWWNRALVFQVVQGEGPVTIGVSNLPIRFAWHERGAAERVSNG
jgi:lipopolysaccharide transport system ATP-binding protein